VKSAGSASDATVRYQMKYMRRCPGGGLEARAGTRHRVDKLLRHAQTGSAARKVYHRALEYRDVPAAR
jgi:hypothetical protein